MRSDNLGCTSLSDEVDASPPRLASARKAQKMNHAPMERGDRRDQIARERAAHGRVLSTASNTASNMTVHPIIANPTLSLATAVKKATQSPDLPAFNRAGDFGAFNQRCGLWGKWPAGHSTGGPRIAALRIPAATLTNWLFLRDARSAQGPTTRPGFRQIQACAAICRRGGNASAPARLDQTVRTTPSFAIAGAKEERVQLKS